MSATVRASARRIALVLTLTATPAGPGHYVVSGAQLIPGGTWAIQLTDRVSAFDEYLQTMTVPIQ